MLIITCGIIKLLYSLINKNIYSMFSVHEQKKINRFSKFCLYEYCIFFLIETTALFICKPKLRLLSKHVINISEFLIVFNSRLHTDVSMLNKENTLS